jgi:hypothetical protein
MSMSSVHHVREKSQSKGSARTLLLNLAIYANECCGVAWPSDATLYHDVNVSRQRIQATCAQWRCLSHLERLKSRLKLPLAACQHPHRPYPTPAGGACPTPATVARHSAWLEAAPAGGSGTRSGPPAPRVQRGRRGGAKRAFNFLSAALHFLAATPWPWSTPHGACTGAPGGAWPTPHACRPPTVVAGTTNAATIMSGERGADLVREPLRRTA